MSNKNTTVKKMKIKWKNVLWFYSRNYLLTSPFCCNRMLFKQTKFSINGYLNPSVLNDELTLDHLIPWDLNIHSIAKNAILGLFKYPFIWHFSGMSSVGKFFECGNHLIWFKWYIWFSFNFIFRTRGKIFLPWEPFNFHWISFFGSVGKNGRKNMF